MYKIDQKVRWKSSPVKYKQRKHKSLKAPQVSFAATGQPHNRRINSFKMINNNLDYERNSNTMPAGVDIDVAPAATTITLSTTISPTTANSNNRNSNSNSNHPSVDNGSYFNRFDNRIAANLAAVLTGSRFRSSSTSSPTKTLQKTKNANNLRTAHGFSNSSTNMHAVGSAVTQHYSGVSTLGGGRKPPAHLQLHNVGSDSRPSSPQLHGSVGRNRRPLHLFTQANLKWVWFFFVNFFL